MKTEVEFFIGKDRLTWWRVVKTHDDGTKEIIARCDQGRSAEQARENFAECFLTKWNIQD